MSFRTIIIGVVPQERRKAEVAADRVRCAHALLKFNLMATIMRAAVVAGKGNMLTSLETADMQGGRRCCASARSAQTLMDMAID